MRGNAAVFSDPFFGWVCSFQKKGPASSPVHRALRSSRWFGSILPHPFLSGSNSMAYSPHPPPARRETPPDKTSRTGDKMKMRPCIFNLRRCCAIRWRTFQIRAARNKNGGPQNENAGRQNHFVGHRHPFGGDKIILSLVRDVLSGPDFPAPSPIRLRAGRRSRETAEPGRHCRHRDPGARRCRGHDRRPFPHNRGILAVPKTLGPNLFFHPTRPTDLSPPLLSRDQTGYDRRRNRV